MNYKIIDKNFYSNKNTIKLSKELLGKILVKESIEGLTSGRIVETESYLYNDPAAHTFIGKTPRNKSAFEEAGTSYVYFIYGNYYCFNVGANKKNTGEAVLIRALEPVDGIDLMKSRILKFNSLRKHIKYKDIPITKLCNGPGKLCLALDIDKNLDGHKLWNKPFYIADDGYKVRDNDIITTTRIGITKAAEMPYRFYLKDSPFISKK